MLTIVAIVILVVVAAIAIYCVQSRKRKYIFKTAGSSPNEYGTYVTDATDSFGGVPSIPTDKEGLVTSIQMETKTESLPSSSLVTANPVALELEVGIKEKETLMTTGDGGGEGEKGESEKGEVEKLIDETNKDTHL